MKRLALIPALIACLVATEAVMAAGVDLSAIGVAYANSDGASTSGRSGLLAANAPGTTIFGGTTTTAASHCGEAFGAGSGKADNNAWVITLTARARARLVIPIPFPPGCTLSAWGLGHADPTPDPCIDVYSDDDLLGIFGDSGTIPDGVLLDETEFDQALLDNPIGPDSPGGDGKVTATVEFDDPGDQILFSFYPGDTLTLERSSGCTGTLGVCIKSSSLGIERTWSVNESGQEEATGGWSVGDVTVTESDGQLQVSDLDGLDFSHAVGSGFTQEDFEQTDVVLQFLTTTAVAKPTPTVSEWGMIIMTLLLLTAGTVIFGRARRRAAAA